MIPFGFVRAAAICALSTVFAVVPAHAEVTVRGDAADLTVEAEAATVEDVIVAIGEAVGSSIEPPPDLPSAMVTGVYQGSVAEVLKALAPAADFVVAWRDGGVFVHFFDGDERAPMAEATPADADNGKNADGEPEASEQSVPGEPAGEEPPTPARKVY